MPHMPVSGINFSERQLEYVDKDLRYGDSRSERVRQVVDAGIAVERAMKQRQLWLPDHEARLERVEEIVELGIEEWKRRDMVQTEEE